MATNSDSTVHDPNNRRIPFVSDLWGIPIQTVAARRQLTPDCIKTSTPVLPQIARLITSARPTVATITGPATGTPAVKEPQESPVTAPGPKRARRKRSKHKAKPQQPEPNDAPAGTPSTESRAEPSSPEQPSHLDYAERADVINRIFDVLSTIYYHQELVSQIFTPIAEDTAEAARQILWCTINLPQQPSVYSLRCAALKLAAGKFARETLELIKNQDEELDGFWHNVMQFHCDEYLRERVALDWVELNEQKIVCMVRRFGRQLWMRLAMGNLPALVQVKEQEPVLETCFGELKDEHAREFIRSLLAWGKLKEVEKWAKRESEDV